MVTEIVFEYHHKKFDRSKRSRDSSDSDIISKPFKKRRQDIIGIDLTLKQTKIEQNSPSRNDCEKRIAANDQQLSQKLNHFTDQTDIKMEVPDSPEAIRLSPITSHTQPAPIKVKLPCDNKLAIKVKQELIELNTTNVPKIPQAAYEEICKFRANMVRKFPKKERGAKEQERRDKNTLACRRSRRVKKIEQVAIEEEYKGFKDMHLRMTELAIRAAAYFKELTKQTEDEIIVVD